MSFVRKIREEEKEREREIDGVKVVFLRRKRRISSNELYSVDYSRCLSYEKFVRKREREMELRLSFFLEYHRTNLFIMWIIVDAFIRKIREEEKQSIDH